MHLGRTFSKTEDLWKQHKNVVLLCEREMIYTVWNCSFDAFVVQILICADAQNFSWLSFLCDKLSKQKHLFSLGLGKDLTVHDGCCGDASCRRVYLKQAAYAWWLDGVSHLTILALIDILSHHLGKGRGEGKKVDGSKCILTLRKTPVSRISVWLWQYYLAKQRVYHGQRKNQIHVLGRSLPCEIGLLIYCWVVLFVCTCIIGIS